MANTPPRTWMCLVCGFIYDEGSGFPTTGIMPDTPWEKLPADWRCPDCRADKADFEQVEL